MSDLETQIRNYARWLADTADAVSNDHDARATTPYAGRPHWRRRGVMLAAATAVVALVVGLAAVVRAPSEEIPADTPPPTPPTASLEADGHDVLALADGYELSVVGEREVVDGVEVWQGAPAPPLAGALDDVVGAGASSVAALLKARAASEIVLPDEFAGDGVERVVTVGEIDSAVVFAHAATRAEADRDVRCVLVAPQNDPTDWLSGCGIASPDGTRLGLGGGFGQWIVWTDIPADTALVELRGTGDASTWQYPIARTVAFPTQMLDGNPIQLVAYDTNGNTITSPTAPGGTAQIPDSSLSMLTTTTPATITTIAPTTTATPRTATAVPSDQVCLDRILAPPRLIGGGDPGDYTVGDTDADGDPIHVRWGDGESAVTQMLQPTFFGEGPTELMTALPQDYDHFWKAADYEAAVIPVGDPGVGATSIYLRERGTDCIRIYLTEARVPLDEAILFAQAFVNELSDAA